jgi:hypothetical protein
MAVPAGIAAESTATRKATDQTLSTGRRDLNARHPDPETSQDFTREQEEEDRALEHRPDRAGVYQEQVATGVSAGLGPFEIGSQFTIDVMAKPGVGLGTIEQLVNEEMRTLLRDGPTQAELDRIKTVRYAGMVRGLERIDGFGGKSAVLAESQVYGGSPDFYKQQLRWQDQATPRTVQAAAQRWLSDGVTARITRSSRAGHPALRTRHPPPGTRHPRTAYIRLRGSAAAPSARAWTR